jgi:hypothetical protein
VDHDTAQSALAEAWVMGVRYFDTAPHYGIGQSEYWVRGAPSSAAEGCVHPVDQSRPALGGTGPGGPDGSGLPGAAYPPPGMGLLP